MPLLEWKDRYSTGISALDHEHRELIQLINELHGTLGGPESGSVSAFFGDLYAAVSAHFALEEKVMRDRSYREYEAHKTDHERLLDQIRDIMDDYESGSGATYRDALAQELEAWFGRHFQTLDARLFAAFGGDAFAPGAAGGSNKENS